jgi:hypothetical protein
MLSLSVDPDAEWKMGNFLKALKADPDTDSDPNPEWL